ncbi:hypothetical protein [Labrenzia sp. VG12]|uniref:hypothetical protein n=1 Tax=Labrenzia sp. VG12 TaxID=2021862 RepID=UPI000B8BBA7B|nr:hypothetical protein [Labrenzia sp. VG12]ASP36318.1 hypothetical protein CHH27_26260 [Labrenzia sp. VG12]
MGWKLLAAVAIAIAGLLPLAGQAKTVEVKTIPVTPSQETPIIPDTEIQLPSENAAAPASEAATDPEAPEELPQVLYSTDYLPKPVARMHSQLKEAAANGDLDRIRMILESNEMPPTLSFGDIGDPIDFLKQSSGDGEGFEILAILADILDAGFLHVDVGTAQEMYVWPYFARYPLEGLRPDQKVELFRIVTAGDFAEMQEFGAWTFYRLGIGPDGTLHFFVAGD